MSDPVSVTVLTDGPLKISNVPSAQYCGAPISTGQDIYICRCGKSANAPFCDGAHAREGFDGGCEDPPEAEVRVWEGRSLRTRFNTAACMHVFYCKPLKELRARELEGDDDAAQEIMRVVGTCPSGALSFETKEGCEPVESAPADVALDIVEGGEVRLQVPFEINAELHEAQPDDRATLCRCGQSQNKPWCDGRHRRLKDFR